MQLYVQMHAAAEDKYSHARRCHILVLVEVA